MLQLKCNYCVLFLCDINQEYQFELFSAPIKCKNALLYLKYVFLEIILSWHCLNHMRQRITASQLCYFSLLSDILRSKTQTTRFSDT